MQILLAIVAFSLLVIIHELGHFLCAKACGVRVVEFCIGLGPKLFGFQIGETTYALRLLPFGGACMMEDEEGVEGERSPNGEPSPRSFTAQKKWKRLLILAAGPLMNLLTGWIVVFCLLVSQEVVVTPTIADFSDELRSSETRTVQTGDRLISIDGTRVLTSNDISLLLDRYHDDDTYDLVVSRDGKRISLKGEKLVYGAYSYAGGTYQGFGLLLKTQQSNVLTSISGAFSYSAYYARLVRFGLTDLLCGNASVKDMSGPVGITATMSDVVKTGGLRSLFMLLAFITINLGLTNLLPIPALDGGRIVFLAIEAILTLFGKKRIPRNWEAAINGLTLLLLLILIGLVTVNDISRLIAG